MNEKMTNEIAKQDSATEKESFRDRIATVDAKGKRKWVYAQKPKGKIYNVRTWVSWGFFALFFTLPFISYHGRPLFLFNIPEAEFIIFGKVFWPQDFFIFWSDDAHLHCFHRFVYSSIWPVVLRMDLSPDYFYGNAFPQS